MGRYMEIIFVSKEGDCFQTGVGAEMKTDHSTNQAFESVRQHEVDIKEADFILDLHEDDGSLIDSIALKASALEQVTGEKFKGEQFYRDYDKAYWDTARKTLKEQTS